MCKTLSLSLWLYMLIATNAFAQLPGSLDLTFDPAGGTDELILATAVQADGKIIISGFFSTYNGVAANGIARLLPDGSLDPTFQTGTGTDEFVSALVIQPDGRIIIAGPFEYYNGTVVNGVARLNSDGSLDTGFNTGTGTLAWGAVDLTTTVVLQPDGKVVLGGSFEFINNVPRKGIARLNTDGSLDTSFNPGSGVVSSPAGGGWGIAYHASLQPDGKIIICGGFDTYNGTPSKGLARINPDGNLDMGFNVGTGANNEGIFVTALQSDGKIIVGGDFTQINGAAFNKIARLNTNGSVDMSFNIGSGISSGIDYIVHALIMQANDKVIVGGDFLHFDGIPRKGILRINANGSLDNTFDPGTGININSIVVTAAVNPDGKVILAGDFETYNGITRNHIARIHADGVLSAPELMASQVNLFPNPTTRQFAISVDGLLSQAAPVLVYNPLGQLVLNSIYSPEGNTTYSLKGLPAGIYLVRLHLHGKVITKKLVLE